MSTPFPLEEAQQFEGRPTFDPSAQPKTPEWYAGLGYDDTGYPKALGLIEGGVLSGIAKGQAVLGGALHRDTDLDYSLDEQGGLVARDTGEAPDNRFADYLSADAKAKIKAFTPDANTTGAAAQILHSVVSGATEMAIGGIVAGPVGAAVAVGSGEGVERYNELIEAGVDPATARKAAGVTSVAAGLGAFMPGGFGGSLAAKVATGAAANTAFGMVNRYADHRVLENAGYDAMADQQKVLDGTQALTDLILGAAFGGLAHLHDLPQVEAMREAAGARDAALTTNLALSDRKAAVGIPADPQAANAHQHALESSIESLMRGHDVDVSDSGVTQADFVARDERPNQDLEATVRESIDEHDLFGEDNARDVEAILSGQERPEAKEVRTAPPPKRDYILARNPSHEIGYPLLIDREGMMRNRLEERPVINQEGIDAESNDMLTQAIMKEARDSFDENGNFIGKPYQVTNNRGVYEFDTLESARDFAETSGMRGGKRRKLQDLDDEHPERAENEAPQPKTSSLKAKKPEGEAEPNAHADDDTARILADRPDLTIPDENGNPVKASDALTAANEELAVKKRESQIAATTAIQCYMRRGN